ncbi:uncharacterized protein LOC131177894 [Hevea brasiliensis]|uniref:uncharacterized protein LOC131177894 n=1 Tax=Hevea brasiliensis TaxID=3981 RepID=UPI0025E11E9C|nr:uncharacterized protein LOC131177894 [Hevea brasiliensis]
MDQLATHNKTLENQIAQQAGSSSKTTGKLPSQSEMNLKKHCKAVTLRSGRILEQPEEKPTEESFDKSESQAEKKEEEDKEALISAPIMQPPDWKLPFEIMCDVSDYAVGAVLGQMKDRKLHAIYYASKTLDDAQINYATIEKEFLAVVFAINKFRSYLLGSKVIIYTDHAAIRYLLNKKEVPQFTILQSKESKAKEEKRRQTTQEETAQNRGSRPVATFYIHFIHSGSIIF